jgi:hypothetical protein
MCYFTSLLQDHCCESELGTRAGDSLETHLAPSTPDDTLALVRFLPSDHHDTNLKTGGKMLVTGGVSHLSPHLAQMTVYYKGLPPENSDTPTTLPSHANHLAGSRHDPVHIQWCHLF